jgi:hypothetical protein
MQAVKISRTVNALDKCQDMKALQKMVRDSIVDGAGYWRCLEKVIDRQVEEAA